MLNPMDESSVFAFYRADSGSNVLDTYSSTFTANATTDTILPAVDAGFSDPNYPNGLSNGCIPVRFTTTGTLPSPLQLNTDYYLSPTTGGNYEIYPVATESDIPNLYTALSGENIHKGQNFFQQLNKINITDTGSGTHTVSKGTTLKTLVDIKSGFNMVVENPDNRHSHISYAVDNNSNTYIASDGVLVKNDNGGSYNQYGKVMLMATDRYNARLKSSQKRYVYLMFVAKIKPIIKKNIKKCIIQSTGFNTTTNILTPTVSLTEYDSGQPFVTGNAVTVKALTGATLPAGLTLGTTYYVRKIATATITLHPTSTDATNNTNIIPLVTQGSGDMMIIEPLTVGDAKRWNFLIEWLAPDSGGNTLSPRIDVPAPLSSGLFNVSSFVTSGSNAGNINSLGFNDLDKVILWATPDAVLPSPLQRDTSYWVTKVPGSGSGVCRLHTTLQSATESVGIATNLSSCIKFTTAGTGNVLFEYDDGKFVNSYGQVKSSTLTKMERVNYNEKAIIFMAIDYNPDAGTVPIGYLKFNNSALIAKDLTGTKGLTGIALNNDSNPWTLFNSAQGHVPIDMDLYSMVMGSHADTPLTETQINQMMNYFATQYTIPTFTPIT